MKRWRCRWQPAIRSLATSTSFWIPLRTTTTGPTDCRYPEARRSRPSSRASRRMSELFTRAREEGADLVLVHHGLFWAGPPRALDRASKRRLQLLFDADMALAAYHLPARRPPRGRQQRAARPGHRRRRDRAVRAPTGARPSASARASPTTASRRPSSSRASARRPGREPLAFTDGPDPVRTIGIVSGAGADHLEDAIAAGLDAFVTGEPAERSMARAAGGRRPLPRRRPLRDRDLRRAGAGRAPGRALRRPPRLRRRAEPDLACPARASDSWRGGKSARFGCRLVVSGVGSGELREGEGGGGG